MHSECNHRQTYRLPGNQFPVTLLMPDPLSAPPKAAAEYGKIFLCLLLCLTIRLALQPERPYSIPYDATGASKPKIDWNILCKTLPEIKPTGTCDAQLNGHRELPAATGEEAAIIVSICREWVLPLKRPRLQSRCCPSLRKQRR